MSDSINVDELRITELNSEYIGVSRRLLMENAGRSISEIISKRFDIKGRKVIIFSGLGGNGGDGLVSGRYLYTKGANVEIYLIGRPENISSPDTKANWEVLKFIRGIKKTVIKDSLYIDPQNFHTDDDTIIIDAVLGVGVRGKLREPILSVVKLINSLKGHKISIDVPTGIDSDTGEILGECVKPELTITLYKKKIGLDKNPDVAGEIEIGCIGINPDVEYTVGPGDLFVVSRPRNLWSHKGDNGRVQVIAGSKYYFGAPALVGLATLRTGVDLVKIWTSEFAISTVASFNPSLIVLSYDGPHLRSDHVDRVLISGSENTAVAIGPGLGLADQTRIAVRRIISELDRRGIPTVVDADAIKAIAHSGFKSSTGKFVFTPHLSEFATLFEIPTDRIKTLDDRIKYAVEAAKKFNVVILLKGHIDVIASPDGRYKLNYSGTPAMTVGGTGDVLTGITAAFLTKGVSPFVAACAAAFIAGKAGEFAVAELGEQILPTDVIDMIPYALRYDYLKNSF